MGPYGKRASMDELRKELWNLPFPDELYSISMDAGRGSHCFQLCAYSLYIRLQWIVLFYGSMKSPGYKPSDHKIKDEDMEMIPL